MRASLTVIFTVALLAACGPGISPELAAPTFAKDVAPIIYRECASCHRAGGAAPFELTSYDDVRRRARQIVDVTGSRYMPPWLPEPGHGDFVGDRILSAADIVTLERWADADAPEGKASDIDMPRLPERVEGWELGEPDLVVEMPEPYELASEGGDVFRNFVLPAELSRSRFVAGFELRPNERRLVHHATITIDPKRASRRLDKQDPGPGFDGMRAAPEAVMPDGQFLGWTPGKSAFRNPEGMSWLLEKGSDLVVQLHMPTTGKPEKVRASIGLYFTDEPPRRIPVTLRLGSRHFEIAPGEKNFQIQDDYVLPVDVDVLSIYPHAHYLAREMKARATLPDGTEQWLIYIRDWDFNWQDFYRYREPVSLPTGTRIHMEFTYDNSEDNPRNPSRPATPVAYGPQSTDEMGDLYLQVLPKKMEELEVLRADYTEKELEGRVRELTFRIERNAADADAMNSLGVVYDRLGRTDEAIDAIRRAVRADPGLEDAHFNLGTLLAARGDRAQAAEHFETVLRADPDCVDCRVRLGNVFRDQGRLDEARVQLERAVIVDHGHAWGQYSLGIVFQMQGRLEDAIARYREVVELEPENVDARLSLGSALTATKQCVPAVLALESATRLAPEWSEPWSRLAWALTSCPHYSADALDRAVAAARQAAQLSSYGDPSVLDNLGAALAASGNEQEARVSWQRALELARRSGDASLAEELERKLSRR